MQIQFFEYLQQINYIYALINFKITNMNLLKFSFLLVISIFFTSCEKDDLEILQGGIWKLQDIKLHNISVIEDCNKDDTMEFGSSKVFFNRGVVKCYEDDVNSESTYTLLSDQKALVFGSSRVKISLLTETKLTYLTTNIFGDFFHEYSK